MEGPCTRADDAYAAHFNLGRRAPAPAVPASRPREPMNAEPGPTDAWCSSRRGEIMQCVRADGHHVILAGIGHAFFAARAAKLLLAAEGMEVDVLVETGMYGIDCAASGPFLLGHDVISGARRLSSIEDALGAVACGADNKCVGVVGAAQVDRFGNLDRPASPMGRCWSAPAARTTSPPRRPSSSCSPARSRPPRRQVSFNHQPRPLRAQRGHQAGCARTPARRIDLAESRTRSRRPPATTPASGCAGRARGP